MQIHIKYKLEFYNKININIDHIFIIAYHKPVSLLDTKLESVTEPLADYELLSAYIQINLS